MHFINNHLDMEALTKKLDSRNKISPNFHKKIEKCYTEYGKNFAQFVNAKGAFLALSTRIMSTG